MYCNGSNHIVSWAPSQYPMKAEWAIDSEAMRAVGIIVLAKSS